jgi:ribosomal protein S18 acetylase RimI-like enzyme
MKIQHYDEVMAIWKTSGGIALRTSDPKQEILNFLNRNQGLSFVANRDGKLIGAVLCGYDGRRGYIYHLAVNKKYRFKGVGQALIERCLVLRFANTVTYLFKYDEHVCSLSTKS